jgi:hypothetical protein
MTTQFRCLDTGTPLTVARHKFRRVERIDEYPDTSDSKADRIAKIREQGQKFESAEKERSNGQTATEWDDRNSRSGVCSSLGSDIQPAQAVGNRLRSRNLLSGLTRRASH